MGDFFHPPRVCLHLRHKSRHSIIDFKAKRPYSLTLGVKGGESGRPTKGSAGRQGSARDARSAVRVPRQRFGALMHSLLHAFEHDSFRRSGGNSAQGVARKTQPSYGQHQACLIYSIVFFPIREPTPRTTAPRRFEATPEAKKQKIGLDCNFFAIRDCRKVPKHRSAA